MAVSKIERSKIREVRSQCKSYNWLKYNIGLYRQPNLNDTKWPALVEVCALRVLNKAECFSGISGDRLCCVWQSPALAQWPCHPTCLLFLWQWGRTCVLANLEYLVILISCRPCSEHVSAMCDSAYVSGTVTSQAIGFPVAYGRG